uniref:Uncharacterized protein n=1 Tax=Nelumbo nucifera TaxID=4432 RepID=A0A822YGV5_NELNU|nr:TPA_asm: hypothetical protein HUJ06_031693 [Nelumbo nucifera]
MNNSLTGLLVLPPHPCVNLSVLILSNNNFSGSIPTNIDVIFPNLRTLKLSQNCFEGKIAPSIGKMKSLWILDPANNNLSGQIPQHLIMGCSSLAFLKLSYNNLYGKILPTITNLTSLMLLYLDHNLFGGNLPDRDGPNYLSELDISHNNISGALPSWLGNLSSLQSLVMRNNHLEGSIPSEFCQLHRLRYLDLSENDIQGLILSCFSSQYLEHVHLQKNRVDWWAFIPKCPAFERDSILRSNSSSIVPVEKSQHNGLVSQLSLRFDTSCLNNITFKGESNSNGRRNSEVELTGFGYMLSCIHIKVCFLDIKMIWGGEYITVELEVEFTTKFRYEIYKGVVLELMSGIDLSCNKLVGNIPPEIGDLSDIHALNLSHNYLNGQIPPSFSSLRKIESLDLSYNNLMGMIPP